jgi:hypothetical protein
MGFHGLDELLEVIAVLLRIIGRPAARVGGFEWYSPYLKIMLLIFT